MQSMQYPKVVAFVEGTMEKLFVNRNFHYVRLISMDNGITWTLDALCNRIINTYRVMDPNSDLIVIWLDREARQETSLDMSSFLRAKLLAEGVPEEKLAIMICDRMTENVILADEELIQAQFDDETYTYDAEGGAGKRILKKMYRKHGLNYSETSDGVKLLKSMKLVNSAKNSDSADQFLQQLKLSCWWTGQN